MDINEISQLNLDELYSLISNYIEPTRDEIEPSKHGRNWFKFNKEKIKEKVCTNYQNLIKMKGANAIIEVAATIGDSLSGVPALIIAAIVIRTGLDHFCSE